MYALGTSAVQDTRTGYGTELRLGAAKGNSYVTLHVVLVVTSLSNPLSLNVKILMISI